MGRTTIARILKSHGTPPVPERPTSWQTFLRAHWGAIAGADFFTTEVWTAKGLVTFYTLFIIDLASRRVRILGSTPRPDGLFMQQMARHARLRRRGAARLPPRSHLRSRYEMESGRPRAPDRRRTPRPDPVQGSECECVRGAIRTVDQRGSLNRLIPLGERHFRHAIKEFVIHYQRERPHQGRDNTLLTPYQRGRPDGSIRCRQRLGGMLNFYARAA